MANSVEHVTQEYRPRLPGFPVAGTVEAGEGNDTPSWTSRATERTVSLEAVSLPDIPITGGGLFVLCDDPPPLGRLVPLRLLLPEGPPLHLTGRVVWTNPGGRNPFPTGMGLRLLGSPPGEAERLAALLERGGAVARPAMAEAWYAVRPARQATPSPARPRVV
ncbi:MAG: PilZ domain-containing protein [candidate division NC10 bacterium]|nr:PilZ domain-containing protein [candidate division NC10 bacterium]